MKEEKGNIKFQQIIHSAKDLFWRFGMRRVTVEEICRGANVSKMTFYKYFDNKIELAKYIYSQVISVAEDEYREIMEKKIPFSEKIKLTMQLKMKGTQDLSQEFINELLQNVYPEMTAFYHQKVKESLQRVLDDYTLAQKNGEIRPDIKPEFILFFLNHMLELVTDKKLVSLYENPQQMISELMNFFFYGILPRETRMGEKNEK
jgi:AcrR family transcriptional regulator